MRKHRPPDLLHVGFVAIFLCLTSLSATAVGARPPNVVVTIKPVHALAAAVMRGVGEPYLLIRGMASPHGYSMRPSDARALEQADLLVYVGQSFERFLVRPLQSLSADARHLALLELRDDLKFHALRSGGAWSDAHDDEHGHHDDEERLDGHIWLDPDNAKAIVRVLASELATLDPANRARYEENRDAAVRRITALDAELQQLLTAVSDVPFIVFHDAYQYFDRHYGLRVAGSIAVSPERQPGPRRLARIRERIRDQSIRCLFVEPQFSPATARMVVDGTQARVAELDPLGAGLSPGPDAYQTLMRNLARALRSCLES